MLAIRLPLTIERRLGRLAKRTGRTKTYYAREAILQHLEDLEDVYLAEKRLAEVRAGRVRTIPLEKVMRRYGIKPKVED
ncbi:MAG: TraY domain-containing protein [Terriglobales bacterium]|jgi:RHH-type transcriptional regulator, rel operon repressor / antitoxin RelB